VFGMWSWRHELSGTERSAAAAMNGTKQLDHGDGKVATLCGECEHSTTFALWVIPGTQHDEKVLNGQHCTSALSKTDVDPARH
jgi:hypothetical protein